MGARQRMTMRCTIQRNESIGVDGYGNPAAPEWHDHLLSLACYVWYDRGKARKTKHEDKTSITLNLAHMICPMDTDITNDDRITTITDRKYIELFGAFTIDSAIKRRDHIELILEEIG